MQLEITRREGLSEGLKSMDQWLTDAERRMIIPRSLPLNMTKLSDLVRIVIVIITITRYYSL